MPWFIASLLGGLQFAMKSLAVQVLIGLGIGVATYTGVDVGLAYFKSQALASFQGLPSTLISLLAYMKVGVAINIVFSAMLARVSMNMVRTGAGVLAIKRFFKI